MQGPAQLQEVATHSWPARVLVGVVTLTLLLELLWLVVAFLALRTGALRASLNAKPEELFMEWRSAWSWFPGRVRIEGFRIRGQDKRDQWSGEAEEADLVVALWPLLARKEISGQRARLSGVSFWLRPRLDAVPAGSVQATNLAPIDGYSNPPEIAPAEPPVSEPSSGRHWAIRLPQIEVDDLRELWINEASLGGSGRLRGRLDYTLSGPFEAEVFDFRMPGALVRAGGTTLSTNLDVRLEAVLGPLRFSECRGDEYFRRLSAALDLEGDFSTAELLSRHLGGTGDMEIDGTGRLQCSLRVQEGRFLAPGHLQLTSSGLTVRLADVMISGEAEVVVDVSAEPGTNTVVSEMNVTLRRLRLQHRDTTADAVDSGDLELRAVAHNPSVPDGFRDVTVDVRLGPLRLADARVLNGFLPGTVDGEFFRGGFGVEAGYHRPQAGPSRGHLRIAGEDLAFRLGAREFSGVLDANAAFSVPTNRLVMLEPSRVTLTIVVVSGMRSRSPDGWHAAVDIDRGGIELGGATNMWADVRLELLDTRPLLALLREDEESPGWLRFIPNLKNLRGGTTVLINATELVLRDFRLRGSATEVLAQLSLRKGAADGILYARYGLISAGFDLRGGAREWSLFGAKRTYQRRLAEMNLADAELPEGDDEEDAGR